jgi:hypothetical protein
VREGETHAARGTPHGRRGELVFYFWAGRWNRGRVILGWAKNYEGGLEVERPLPFYIKKKKIHVTSSNFHENSFFFFYTLKLDKIYYSIGSCIA